MLGMRTKRFEFDGHVFYIPVRSRKTHKPSKRIRQKRMRLGFDPNARLGFGPYKPQKKPKKAAKLIWNLDIASIVPVMRRCTAELIQQPLFRHVVDLPILTTDAVQNLKKLFQTTRPLEAKYYTVSKKTR